MQKYNQVKNLAERWRNYLRRLLVKAAFKGVKLDYEDFRNVKSKERAQWLQGANYALRHTCLIEEIRRLQDEAGKSIVRHARGDTDVAWNRGIIHGLDALEKRFRYLNHE